MKFVIALAFGLTCLNLNAQPVHRCGNEYSQSPCGHGRLVDAADERSNSQRADAGRVAQRERQLAATMRSDRLADEAAMRPRSAASLSGTPAPAAKTTPALDSDRSERKKQPKRVSIRVARADKSESARNPAPRRRAK